jgi:hypothetical protein
MLSDVNRHLIERDYSRSTWRCLTFELWQDDITLALVFSLSLAIGFSSYGSDVDFQSLAKEQILIHAQDSAFGFPAS